MVNNEKPDFLKEIERQLDIERQLNAEYELRGYLSLGRLYEKLGFNAEPTSEVWDYVYIKGKGLCLLEGTYMVNQYDGTITRLDLFESDLFEPNDITIF